ACLYTLECVRAELPTIFEPLQLGVGARGGPERAVHRIQAGLELMGPESVLLKCNFRNAFNTRRRDEILSSLFQTDSLRPLWRLSHWAYRSPTNLLVFDKGQYCGVIPSAEGVRQGDCLGSLLFSLSVQRFYTECLRDLDGVSGV